MTQKNAITETAHKPLATVDLALGMYRGSNSLPDEARLERYMQTHPAPYLRLYILFPRDHIETLTRIRAAIFEMDQLHKNRLYLKTIRVNGEMHWQIVSLYPGVPALNATANQYIAGLSSGQIHRDSKAKQFRTSFGLVKNPFIARAYEDCSGYRVYMHRAVNTPFVFYRLDDAGVVAVSSAPIKDYISRTLRLREEHKNLKIHRFPLAPLTAKFPAHAPSSSSKETNDTPPEPLRAPAEEPPAVAPVTPPADPSIATLLAEGDALCLELNRWLKRVQTASAWRPTLQTHTDAEQHVHLRLSLCRDYEE